MSAVHTESIKDKLMMESHATAGNELLTPKGIYIYKNRNQNYVGYQWLVALNRNGTCTCSRTCFIIVCVSLLMMYWLTKCMNKNAPKHLNGYTSHNHPYK